MRALFTDALAKARASWDADGALIVMSALAILAISVAEMIGGK